MSTVKDISTKNPPVTKKVSITFIKKIVSILKIIIRYLFSQNIKLNHKNKTRNKPVYVFICISFTFNDFY